MTALLATRRRALVTASPTVICGGWLVGVDPELRTAWTTCVEVFRLPLASVAITVMVLVPNKRVSECDQLVPPAQAARPLTVTPLRPLASLAVPDAVILALVNAW